MLKCEFCGEKPANALWHGKPCCFSCFNKKKAKQRSINKTNIKLRKRKV